MKYTVLILVSIVCFAQNRVLAQRNVSDSIIGAVWLGIQYGYNITDGDLADRHGEFNHVGIYAGYKTKRNWVLGVDGNFMFGNKVKVQHMFDHLLDSKGNITDQNGDIAIVMVYSRGWCADLNVGKVIPVLSPNKNSGIYVSVGSGFLMHKVRVETQDHVVPQLELDYRKGYDRLSTGINTQQFLGYAFMANQGFLNFYAGFYAQQGYTFNRRTIFFDKPDEIVSTDMMLDLQYGIKAGWLIPVYKRKPKEYYYN